MQHPKYRPDIDGLRAIAVLSVVVFHAMPKTLKGGFVGVDIFFVISGYLISTIILQGVRTNSFSFVEFYVRRIRRIFPALIVVLATSFIFGWFALTADEYRDLGKHIAAGAGFVSNFVFWNEAGYFDKSAELKPLLHLWSLGIEEQFYIFWPLLIWLGWKYRTSAAFLILAVMALSFVANVWEIRHDRDGAFYLPQARFWELAVGGFLAWLEIESRGKATLWNRVLLRRFDCGSTLPSRWRISWQVADGLSIFGLGLIIFALFAIDRHLSFPGFWAVIPVVGAAAILAAGANAAVNRFILARREMVWVGLISYPLYLWHWPLLSFVTIVESKLPADGIRLALVIAALLPAWLTYRFIERPLRFGGRENLRAAALSGVIAIVGCFGLGTYWFGGLAFRPSPVDVFYEGDIGHDKFFAYGSKKYAHCTDAKIFQASLEFLGYRRCLQSDAKRPVDMVVIGDSHAEHLFIGLAAALPDRNIAYYIKNDIPFVSRSSFKDIFSVVASDQNIKAVVVSAYWSIRTEEMSAADLAQQLGSTIDRLERAGKQVFLSDDVPHFSFSPLACGFARAFSTRQRQCDVSADEISRDEAKVRAAFKVILADHPETRLLEIGKYFCRDSHCSMSGEGKLLFRDNSHLNIPGSLYVGRRLVDDYGFALRRRLTK